MTAHWDKHYTVSVLGLEDLWAPDYNFSYLRTELKEW